MKKTSLLLMLLFITAVGTTISCEPDDICATSTPTTPSLIIDVFDVVNPENKKAITKLFIAGAGNNFSLTNGIVSASQLILPLKTDADLTEYILIKDAVIINDNGTPDDASDDTIDGNMDTIAINYTREEVYVSRACGYKTIFKNVTLTINPDTDNWIKSRQPLIDNQTVENETETHFNIFH